VSPSPPNASNAPSPGNSLGSQIVSLDPVEHKDIPDAAVDQLDLVPSDRVPQEFARIVACDRGKLRGDTTGTLRAGLCHTVVSLGESLGQWPHDSPGVPPRQVEELLQLVDRRGIRAALLHETRVAAGGADRRLQHQRDRDGHQEESPAQRSRVIPV